MNLRNKFIMLIIMSLCVLRPLNCADAKGTKGTKVTKAVSIAPNATPTPAAPVVLEDRPSRQLVVDLMETIKEDPDYHSFDNMLDDIKAEHTIKYHKPNAPFFYTNDKYVLRDLITMVMIDPNGIIDETKTGVLKVYRDFDYHDELEDIFGQEPFYRRVIPEPKKFQDDYLGVTNTGPTNRIMITLKIKGDEQNENTFAKRIAYTGNNIDFVDAFPDKGPPPPPKTAEDNMTPKDSSNKTPPFVECGF